MFFIVLTCILLYRVSLNLPLFVNFCRHVLLFSCHCTAGLIPCFFLTEYLFIFKHWFCVCVYVCVWFPFWFVFLLFMFFCLFLSYREAYNNKEEGSEKWLVDWDCQTSPCFIGYGAVLWRQTFGKHTSRTLQGSCSKIKGIHIVGVSFCAKVCCKDSGWGIGDGDGGW